MNRGFGLAKDPNRHGWACPVLHVDRKIAESMR
jgi:hypothetical protein